MDNRKQGFFGVFISDLINLMALRNRRKNNEGHLSEKHLLWGARKHCFKKYGQILLMNVERSTATAVFHNVLRKPVAPVRTLH